MKENGPLSQFASHHGTKGGFRNPWPGTKPHGFGDFLKWVLTRPPHGGKNILLDPVWSGRVSPFSFAGPKRWSPPAIPFDTLPPIDLVVQSHDHYDHLDSATVDRLIHAYPSASWLAPLGVGTWLRKRGANVFAELDWWQSTAFDTLTLTCTPAQHFSGRGLNNRDGTLWSGWTIRSTTHTIPASDLWIARLGETRRWAPQDERDAMIASAPERLASRSRADCG